MILSTNYRLIGLFIVQFLSVCVCPIQQTWRTAPSLHGPLPARRSPAFQEHSARPPSLAARRALSARRGGRGG
jgi:hypothetical protein